MKNVFVVIALFFMVLVYGQTWNSFYQDKVDECTLVNITSNLNEFVSFGEKNAASDNIRYNNIVNAKNWLITKYQSFGYTDIVEDNFIYEGKSVTNIVVTKTGETYPNTFVIIDGHYDTLNGVGANDNGSGVSLILEIARVMANVSTDYSVKFINFTLEEQGLFGSQHYADVTSVGLDIRYVFNIDEVGGVAGMVNDTITCESDQGMPTVNNADSSVLTNELAASIELYSSLNTIISYAYASDYMPFEEKGEVITNETTFNHTQNDIIANMDIPYVLEVTKGALGAMLYFTGASEVLGIENFNGNKTSFDVYPNPIEDKVTLMFKSQEFQNTEYSIINFLGKEVISSHLKIENNHAELSLNGIDKGIYLLKVKLNNQFYTKKISVK